MTSRGKGIPNLSKTRIRGQRKVRDYTVTTYPVVEGPKPPPEVKPAQDQPATDEPEQKDQEKGPKTDTEEAPTPEPCEIKTFVSGNPFVEVTKGVLHLYKDNDLHLIDKSVSTGRSEMICVMAVPASQSCLDLLNFLSPLKGGMEHIQIIRDTIPNQYMVLIKFKNQAEADSFYTEFNGKPFNSFDDEVCLLAYVSRVETLKGSDGAGLPLTGHTELPTCPVCLERMDESVDGLLTILCNHSFHSHCLAKWSDSSCPVCRYVQTPEMVAKNVCVECGSADSLWICLICGHIGCGRYVHGHAYKHFCESSHCYAIQPDNNRVWDYVGDNFVHRLLQNKGDGKLVEVSGRPYLQVPDGPALEESDDKVDNMQLEFTYMLTTQLEGQRHYFEEKLAEVQSDMRARVDFLMSKLELVETDRQETEKKRAALVKEKANLEKKLATANQKLTKATADLKDQREMMDCYHNDGKRWKEMVENLEKAHEKYVETAAAEVSELKEQLRDVMFYFEAKAKIEESQNSELQGGNVKLDDSSIPSTSKAARRRQHKR